MKYIKLFEKFTLKYSSDALRMDTMEEFLGELSSGDEDFREEHSEDPDTDMLLDPHEGYERQTYIQCDDNRVIYWEGWSQYCWDSLYQKPEYEGMSKPDAIEKVISERLIPSMSELGLRYVDHDYWLQESYDDYVDSGYIMKIVFDFK
jgi:hypothetical protein